MPKFRAEQRFEYTTDEATKSVSAGDIIEDLPAETAAELLKGGVVSKVSGAKSKDGDG
jgi:hypothetical protein